MAQTNFTPISLYYSATAAAVPTAGNLVAGELAINTADGKLFYKDSAGVVQTIASKNSNSGIFAAGTVSAPSITFVGDTNTGIYSPAADTIAFTEGGVESMRITSAGNVGIGTPSPTANLHIRNTSGNATLKLEFGTGGTESSIVGATGEMSLQVAGSSAMTFYTNSAERVRINSSGNVGFGVVPNATWSPTGVLELGTNGGYLSNLNANGFLALTQNLVNTGPSTYKYAGTAAGTLEFAQSGTFFWQTAPSGTAGATATLTTRMTLSNTGALDVPNRGITVGSMPAGSVIQVVSVAYSTAFSTTSATDVSTGLTASITPTSSTSKILVIITANCRATGVGGNAYFIPGIYRNTSTAIWTGFAQGGNFTSTDFRSPATITYLDSPATTSSTNYLLSLNASLAGSGVAMNNGAGTSTITLMEIAA